MCLLLHDVSVIGYLVHEFGYTPAEFAKGLSAPDIWDACPTQLKLSVILTVGALEWSTETQTPHYMNGGEPGTPPKGPFGLIFKVKEDKRKNSKLAEINNGRLAMIGLFGLISSSKGCIVPGLDSIGLKPYTGEVMAPFTAADAGLPFVDKMVNLGSPFFWLN